MNSASASQTNSSARSATIGQLDGVTVSIFHGLAERLGQETGLIGPSATHDTAISMIWRTCLIQHTPPGPPCD